MATHEFITDDNGKKWMVVEPEILEPEDLATLTSDNNIVLTDNNGYGGAGIELQRRQSNTRRLLQPRRI